LSVFFSLIIVWLNPQKMLSEQGVDDKQGKQVVIDWNQSRERGWRDDMQTVFVSQNPSLLLM
jgi:hypothetical protein